MVKIGTIDVTYHTSIWNKYIDVFKSSKTIMGKKKQERTTSLLFKHEVFKHEDTSILIGCISNDVTSPLISCCQSIPSHLSLDYLFEMAKNEALCT